LGREVLPALDALPHLLALFWRHRFPPLDAARERLLLIGRQLVPLLAHRCQHVLLRRRELLPFDPVLLLAAILLGEREGRHRDERCARDQPDPALDTTHTRDAARAQPTPLLPLPA